jgi:hypothetical protein
MDPCATFLEKWRRGGGNATSFWHRGHRPNTRNRPGQTKALRVDNGCRAHGHIVELHVRKRNRVIDATPEMSVVFADGKELDFVAGTFVAPLVGMAKANPMVSSLTWVSPACFPR